MTTTGAGKRKRNDDIEYKSLNKMGFISLEEVDAEESKEILLKVSQSTVKRNPVKREKVSTAKHPPNKERSTTPEDILEKKVPELPGWKEYKGLDSTILQGLSDAGFVNPTPIQRQVLDVVLKDKNRDVLGNAPTGSGKTLAFLLPIIQSIISSEIVTSLVALIIVPTRELALQIKQHLDVAAKHVPKVQAVTLIGGLSQEKQERLLSYAPNVIIGTPGRLAEIFTSNSLLRGQLEKLNFLILDEADRLVESGHFKDLDTILDLIHACQHNPTRRTFLFSATLMHESTTKKGKTSVKGKGALKQLKQKIRFNDPRPVVLTTVDDLDSSIPKEKNQPIIGLANPESLQHYRLECLAEEKDAHLYGLLRKQPGRTLVFVNTIELVKDLAQILGYLGVKVGGLHAKMQQKQRLKSLDRFRVSSDGVLVTSDVAARGLDIPKVECVIHYHIPRTLDVFLHRSGRTARANQIGTSIALVGPHEQALFNRLIGSSHVSFKDHPLAILEVEKYKPAVILAQKIFRLESTQAKAAHGRVWERRAAEVLGIDIDDGDSARKHLDDDDDDTGDSEHYKKKQRHQISILKSQLAQFLE